MERKLYEQNRLDVNLAGLPCYFKPQLVTAGAEPAGPWLDLANYDKVMFVIMGGDCANIGDTLDALVNQATSAAGANTKPIIGKAITTVTSTATTQNDMWFIHVDISELDVDAYFAFVQLEITISANDTWYIAAFCLREQAVFEPVSMTRVTELID